jgi:hypothetical protein
MPHASALGLLIDGNPMYGVKLAGLPIGIDETRQALESVAK